MNGEIILRRVGLTLAEAHRAAHGTVADRPTLIVEFRTGPPAVDQAAVSGWGECPALPDPGYFYEYTDGAQAMLADVLIPAIVAGGSLEPDAVEAAMSPVPGHPMARSAPALAAEDLAARRHGETLAKLWGAQRDALPAGAALSLRGDPNRGATTDDLAQRAVDLAEQGYRRLKIKIQPGADLAPLEAVTNALTAAGHGSVEVAADANGSYRLHHPGHLDALVSLDRLGLAWLEQPLPADDLVGHARLAERLDTPICLDESVTSIGALKSARALGLRPIVCVKAARLGGPNPARELLAWCRTEGLDTYVGGMLASGIGRAADRALAGLSAATRVGDIGADDRYFTADLTSHVGLGDDGRVPVTGTTGIPGLAVDIDAEELGSLSIDERRWPL